MSKPIVTQRATIAGAVTAPATKAEKLDALNHALKLAEKRLYSMNVGVEVSIQLKSDHVLAEDEHGEEVPTGDVHFVELCWGKHKGKWCLYVNHGIDNDPSTWDVSPLDQAPVDDRLAAAKRLPELVTALLAKASEELSEIDDAIAHAMRFARGEDDPSGVPWAALAAKATRESK